MKYMNSLHRLEAIFNPTGAVLCFIAFILEQAVSEFADYDQLCLGVVLVVVVIVTGFFTYYQEFKSCRIMESFKDMVPDFAFVIRNGYKSAILANQVILTFKRWQFVLNVEKNYTYQVCNYLPGFVFAISGNPRRHRRHLCRKSNPSRHQNHHVQTAQGLLPVFLLRRQSGQTHFI